MYCLDIKFWRSESVKSHLRSFTVCMDCVHWLILCWNIWNLHFGEDRLRLRTSCPLMNCVLVFVCNKTSWLNLVFLMWNISLISNSGYPIVNDKIRQMYVGPHTQYQFLCPLLTRNGLFTYVNNKTIQNFMKIHPLVVLLGARQLWWS